MKFGRIFTAITAAAIVASGGGLAPRTPAYSADTRAVVFVVDTSGSMQGRKLEAAKGAVSALAAVIPENVALGLVSFSSTPAVRVTPTLSRSALNKGVASLTARGKTALIDGILLGLDLVSISDKGAVIVISDGQDTDSTATALDVEQANWRKLQLSIVGVQFDINAVRNQFGPTVARTGGLLISVKQTAKLAKALEVSLAQSGIVPTAEPTPVLEVPTSALDPRRARTGLLLSIALGMSLTTAVMATVLYGYRRRRLRSQLKMVETYRNASRRPRRSLRLSFRPPQLLIDRNEALQLQLDAANLKMAAARYRSLQVLLAFLITLVLALIQVPLILGMIIGSVLALLLPTRLIARRQRKLRLEFQTELPDFLSITASALRAGLPVTQAIETAAKESSGELGRQMARALRETAMGSSLDASLAGVSARLESRDFAWLVTALDVQRRVGGNLSGILEVAAATVRARLELQQEVKTLAAEGLLSAQVLAALPLGMLAFLVLTRWEFVSPLFITGAGWAMLGGALLLMILGYQWIKRLSKFEV